MIKSREPLSMVEALEFVEERKDSEMDVKKFVKKFTKMKPEQAKEIRNKLVSLNLLKLKAESIAKIIDVMPEDAENLNKIFGDVNLDDDEIKKVLDILGEFR
jgi:DNA-directed RNA polymerase subunit F